MVQTGVAFWARWARQPDLGVCGRDSTHTSLAPLYGYSPPGRRVFFKLPSNRGANTTLLSSLSLDGMQPSMAIEGSKTKDVFEAYMEHFAAPKLRARQVFMDNLPAHKGERVRELVESASCKLLYLPPYSPDLSFIEEAFSKIKGLLRKAERRSRQALVEATGKVLDRSALKPQKVSLSTAGTVLRINHFDPCCKIHEGEPLCALAAWNTTEHSGGLVLLTTPQRNLHTRFANSSQKDPADTLAR